METALYMKVGIIGNYGHSNNGDEAILIGVLAQLEALGIQKHNIVIFSNNPTQTTQQYKVHAVPLLIKKGNALFSARATLNQAKTIMKGLDLVIIGGGGLLMDMYRRDAPLYSSLGRMAKRSGCRVIIHAVGAGPIKTKAGHFFIRRLVKIADSVSVRDDSSKQLIEQVTDREDITVVTDPAFAIQDGAKRKFSKELKKIGITAAPYFSSQYWPVHDEGKYQNYIKGMAEAADQLIDQYDAEVSFFSTKHPQDTDVSSDIRSYMKHKENSSIIDEELLPHDILRVASQQDVVIGTRLHSLILSVTAGTPVIGVEYHHKVKHFMQTIGEDTFSCEIGNHPSSIVQSVASFYNNWEDTQKRFEEKSIELRRRSYSSLENIDQQLLSGKQHRTEHKKSGGGKP
ncbi:polysaccharide pyruvyl transferase family protein [Geomicrobium sp. JSM 1781026]|uniref:polysaccharide pyruvyl transferase family protein n=1 Tax=Geomicrobium sp. JSM 1781026 TaxID=3344580 RepID=UPI0035C09506